jgi:PAS domain S-box-containing protein
MSSPDVNAHLAAIVDSSDDAIISKDLNGIVKTFNAAAERMFGYRAAEIIGKPIQTLIPADRQHEEAEILAKLRRGERIDHFETVRVRKDGTLIDISLSVSPIADASGKIVAASKIARDITDRKRRDAVEELLAAIVECSDDAIISQDLDGIVLSFNKAAERMFGYRPQEIIGRSITTLIPVERHDEEVAILDRLRRGERIDHYETVRVHKDGRLIDVFVSVSPLRDSTGKVIGASKVARDITERKRAAARLAEQKDWFRITLNSIGDAVIACDTEGCVTFLNHEAERLTGWPAAEARGQPLAEVFQVVNEITRTRVETPAAIVLRFGHVVALANHSMLLGRDGVERPVSDSAAPIVTSDGRVLGVVLVFRDITQSRRIEDQARRSALERERLLESERAARNEAERANRVKDDFVAMVSHELRTPLNAILGWAELLTRHGTDSRVLSQALEVIIRNTQLQARLISDLLDVSRILSGKLRLERDRVDLTEVVRDCIDGVKADAASKQIHLELSLLPDPLEVIGDAARLQQIVLNLLSNAVKFTPEGGRIDVEARSIEDHARVAVRDTGIGIAAELLPHLFERFRQVSPMTTRRHGGLGLGLSIAKQLVEMHGGTITAFSQGEKQGATFTLELPLMSPAQAAQPRHGSVIDAAAPGVSLRGVRVLVVEDDQDSRDLIRRMLEQYGASVTIAASAHEAIDLIGDCQPSILISDIGLPEMDGYDLIRQVRERSDTSARVPAIALTAFARSQDRTRALQAGFNAHIAKPVQSEELAATVSSLDRLMNAG